MSDFLHSHPTKESTIGLDVLHIIVDRDERDEALRRLTTPPSVTLSRRNLLALLHKLELPNSRRMIVKPIPTGRMIVSVVTDEEAYRDRAPGPMHPDTEAFIRDMGIALEAVRRTRAYSEGCCRG